MPKARSSDRSLASLSRPRSPPTSFTFTASSYSSRVPVAFGVPDFGVATERGASEEREVRTVESSSERTGDRGWMGDGKCGTPKGCGGRGGDTLLGISTYDCPGGVHRSAKQSSPGLDPSRALRALFSTPPPERGNVSRYTRESTERLDISRRSVVAAWFRARFTARERTTYGIPVEVRCGSPFLLFLSSSLFLPPSLSRSLSLSLVCVYVCLPPSRSPTIFFSYSYSYRGNESAGVADLRRAEFGRRSFVFARYFR